MFLDPIFIFGLKLGICRCKRLRPVLKSDCGIFAFLLYMFVSGRTIQTSRWKNASRHISGMLSRPDYGDPGLPRHFFRQGLAGCGDESLLNWMAAGYGDAAVSAMAIVSKGFLC
ncbi:MAG: hypothetical protein ACLTSZ_13225 [Lachnospiraceae bacterium]